jgi:riboflavin biosynthesis pyrimidine reductase
MRRLLPSPDAAGSGAPGLSDAELLADAAAPAGTAPFVRFNMVSSIDGVGVLDGASGGLGTPADRRLFPLLRAVSDAIVVGSGTVRAEGYEGELLSPELRAWRTSRGLSKRPLTVVLSASASLPPQAPIFDSNPAPLVVIAAADAPTERVAALRDVAEVELLESVDPGGITAALTARGLRHLHHEGGPRVLRNYLAAGAVDSLCLTLSPVLAPGRPGFGIDAPGGPAAPAWMDLHRLYEEDSTLLGDYRPREQHA